MSSIMRRRRGLKSAISILLSEGGGLQHPHPLSQEAIYATLPSRRGSGFVQSPSAHPIPGKLNCPSGAPFPDSKSTTWELFTNDGLFSRRGVRYPVPPRSSPRYNLRLTTVNSNLFGNPTCFGYASRREIWPGPSDGKGESTTFLEFTISIRFL